MYTSVGVFLENYYYYYYYYYQTMQRKLKFCPAPLAFGDPGTGKTTALLCGHSLTGAQETRFFSKISKEKVFQLCTTSSIPLGVADPQSKNDISRLIIDLYNGARSGTVGRGEAHTTSTCVISANFTTLEQQRYTHTQTGVGHALLQICPHHLFIVVGFACGSLSLVRWSVEKHISSPCISVTTRL